MRSQPEPLFCGPQPFLPTAFFHVSFFVFLFLKRLCYENFKFSNISCYVKYNFIEAIGHVCELLNLFYLDLLIRFF